MFCRERTGCKQLRNGTFLWKTPRMTWWEEKEFSRPYLEWHQPVRVYMVLCVRYPNSGGIVTWAPCYEYHCRISSIITRWINGLLFAARKKPGPCDQVNSSLHSINLHLNKLFFAFINLANVTPTQYKLNLGHLISTQGEITQKRCRFNRELSSMVRIIFRGDFSAFCQSCSSTAPSMCPPISSATEKSINPQARGPWPQGKGEWMSWSTNSLISGNLSLSPEDHQTLTQKCWAVCSGKLCAKKSAAPSPANYPSLMGVWLWYGGGMWCQRRVAKILNLVSTFSKPSDILLAVCQRTFSNQFQHPFHRHQSNIFLMYVTLCRPGFWIQRFWRRLFIIFGQLCVRRWGYQTYTSNRKVLCQFHLLTSSDLKLETKITVKPIISATH